MHSLPGDRDASLVRGWRIPARGIGSELYGFSLVPRPNSRNRGAAAAGGFLDGLICHERSPVPIRGQAAAVADGLRVPHADRVPVLPHGRRQGAARRLRHGLAHSNRRVDCSQPRSAGARHLFVFEARRSLVCVGMVIGRALGLAEQPRRSSGGGVVQHSADRRHFRAVVPAGAAEVERYRGVVGDDGGGGGVFGSLAGSAALVHALVRGAVPGRSGTRSGRAHTPGRLTVPGSSAGGHHSVDQPARRILRGNSDDRGLRMRRVADDGICGGPWGPAAGRAERRKVFPVCLGVPGGQPSQSVLLSVACARMAVRERPLPVAAHHGVSLAELPSSRGDILRRHVADRRGRGVLVRVERPLHRALAASHVGPRGAAGRAQHSHLHDRGGAIGGLGDRRMAGSAAAVARGGMAAQRGAEIQSGGRRNQRHRRYRPMAPGQRCRRPGGGRPAICPLAAQGVPRGIRSGQVPGRSHRDDPPRSHGAHLHL